MNCFLQPHLEMFFHRGFASPHTFGRCRHLSQRKWKEELRRFMLDEEMELLAECLKDSKEVWTFDGPVHWTPGFPGGSQGNPRTTRSYAWG